MAPPDSLFASSRSHARPFNLSVMNPTSSLKQTALADLEQELATTRRVLERVPDDRLDWKPHEKSFTLGALATHLANLVFYGIATLQGDEFDASAATPTKQAESRDELIAGFDEKVVLLRELLQAADDEALTRSWSLLFGDRVIFTRPRVGVLRGMVINHIVHHRGQLSVYLRLLDVPVPSIYGPSADEPTF